MAVYKYWQIDNAEIQPTHRIIALPEAIKKEKTLGMFEFNISRHKDKHSKKEQLEISVMINGEDYGTIKTNIANIESDINLFKLNGIILDRVKYVELCKLLLDNYYLFSPKISDIDYVVTESIADEVFGMLCQYIQNNNIKPQTVIDRKKGALQLYNIPLSEFNDELSDSQFRKFNFTEIRGKLNLYEYTHVNDGKLDYVFNNNGQRVKMVSIHANKFEEYIKKVQITL